MRKKELILQLKHLLVDLESDVSYWNMLYQIKNIKEKWESKY